MAVIFYRSIADDTARRLQEAIEAGVSDGKSEIFESIKGLSDRFRHPARSECIAILLIMTRAELREILLIKDLFDDVRVILILPDKLSETISIAHKLRPRFLSFIDSDFKDVSTVLEKMLRLVEQKANQKITVISESMENFEGYQ